MPEDLQPQYRQQISVSELQDMLDKAAKKGAQEALAALGLHDEDANTDVKELRDLLDSWRATKKAAWSTAVKVVTTSFLVFIATAVLFKLGSNPLK
jgi:hypothetical protein